MRYAIWIAASLLGAACARPLFAAEEPTAATITSDELEIRDGGARSVFRGHVVLSEPPYEMRADQMSQVRATGIVEARGHIEGTWRGPQGEKIVARGERARYNPSEETVELWENARVVRWETDVDTMPVTVTADRFIARERENDILAQGHVVMEQVPRLRAYSERAKYDRQENALHLWGPGRVRIRYLDPRGTADFISDRAWVSLDPKRARLMDRVRGHIVPAKP